MVYVYMYIRYMYIIFYIILYYIYVLYMCVYVTSSKNKLTHIFIISISQFNEIAVEVGYLWTLPIAGMG